MHSPEQMRKKAAAEQESLRHLRYAQADRMTHEAHEHESPAIERAEHHVKKATEKENATIHGEGGSINDNRY